MSQESARGRDGKGIGSVGAGPQGRQEPWRGCWDVRSAEHGLIGDLRTAALVGTDGTIPGTNVLITRFFTEDGLGEIQDFMPVTHAGESDRQRLIRRMACERVWACDPHCSFGSKPAAMSGTGFSWDSPSQRAAGGRS
ncbi:hypothetical protein SAMN06272765_6150 [Streptomyces sp. Ag109_G2-15]|nr:hypothetical protein SAMN06272765_6150 [Streptomyces sp. Ag109_G2-15]